MAVASVSAALLVQAAASGNPVPYSIGNPTDMEQYYVEMINWTRANPQGEAQLLKNTTDASVLAAYSYFGVNLNLMVTQFASISAAPPVSINAKLTAAAEAHSEDMLVNDYQGHVGTDNSQPWDRITAQGYVWNAVGENVYASATSPFYGEAGLEVDWGGTNGGMQSPAGHRENTHNAIYSEVGVGVQLGSNGDVGPQVLTQDFATQSSGTPFITGVAYYDLNANSAYDMGEGIGGITVTVTGNNYYATTSTSGGYSVPVPGNGSYVVSFSGTNLTTVQTLVTISGSANSKYDFVPQYNPPTITGPATLATTQTGSYNFTAVGAATGYEYRISTLTPYSLVEGAENGATGVTASVSGYAVIETDTVKNGTHAFHLAHPDPSTQTLQLNHLIRVASGSNLTFWSRLGWASSGQIAAAQISADGGTTWTDVWTQAGTNGAGQTAFALQTVSLNAYAGQNIIVRFQYRFTAGTYYPQTAAGVGFYIDDIAVSNAQELTNVTVAAAGNGTFTLPQQAAGNYLLDVHALLPGGRILPWGPAKNLTVQASAQNAVLTVIASPSNGGSVTGSGTFPVGSSQTISASANSGWTFTKWSDSNTSATRTVTIPTGGASYTATFTQTPVAAQLTGPTSGTTLTSGSATFTFSGGVGVTSYYFTVGSKLNGTDVFVNYVTGGSQTVKVPVDGRTLYVTLYSMINGKWVANNYTYTALSGQAQLTGINGGPVVSTLPAGSVTFTWNTSAYASPYPGGAGSYLVGIGNAPGKYDIFVQQTAGTSVTVNTLPQDGRTIYFTLFTYVNGTWLTKNYTFVTPNVPPVPAAITTATTGSTILTTSGTFTAGTVTFQWTPGVRVTSYFLTIGSTAGGYDLFAGIVSGTSKAVNVPVDGRTLYVTLYSMINGAWVPTTYTYTAYSAQAKLTAINGGPVTSTLPAGSVTFTWSPNATPSALAGGSYVVGIGTAPGKYDVFAKQVADTSVTVTNLPQDGRTLYFTLFTYINGAWVTQTYTFKAG